MQEKVTGRRASGRTVLSRIHCGSGPQVVGAGAGVGQVTVAVEV